MMKPSRMTRGWNGPNLCPLFHPCLVALILIVPALAGFNLVTGIDDARIVQVAMSPKHPSFMAVASENALYVSNDSGSSFRKAAVLKDEQINRLFIDSAADPVIYLAASRNGYRLRESLEKIFTASEGEQVQCVIHHNGALYAGTSKGLFHTNAALINWTPVPGLINTTVRSIEPSEHGLYVTCDAGVYLYQPAGRVKRLFIARNSDDGTGLTPYELRIDTMTPSRLWLCTSKGVYTSEDRGETWQKFYMNGPSNAAAHCLVQFPLDGSSFYLCCSAGFFKVDIATGEARSLFEGLPSSNIRWAELTDAGDAYLATDQGLFRQSRTPTTPPDPTIHLEIIMRGEPTIQEVQEAAMRYNSVHPDKTGRWRRRIQYRGLMPRLSVDYDKTIGSSFTSSGHYYAQGPYDWGVSLTWDMGDLLWNTYEDDIDNRTKLTTQLRMDILDEVNRLYFERLRLKHEIAVAQSILENTTLRELRLNELTATLDGYTGGLYARQNQHALP